MPTAEEGRCSGIVLPMDLKFALAILHFNVQYVAGGMDGFGVLADDRSAEQVEDQIVTESFEPVLDLFMAHPTWGHDIEMQGYMLEVIAARHPVVLTKLQELVRRGQIEVMSFHYSDQLFMAFPPASWERTIDLNRETFNRLGVPLSGAVFCQEGQAGFGMAAAMRDKGYDVLVWPKNLFSYQEGDVEPAPFYAFGDVTMVTSRDLKKTVAGNGIDLTWTYVDDGELLATGGINPYFPSVFVKSDKAVREYEAKLVGLEASGYSISTVSKYAAALSALPGVVKAQPPPLLDGTWQPDSTDGIQKWLGGRGLMFRDERDNDVRSLQALAQRELVVAETVAKKAGIANSDIEYAWRLLALGEVSDASGINPFRGEVEYGIAHAAEALRIARDVVHQAKDALGIVDGAWIDTSNGSVSGGAPPAGDGAPVDLPIAVTADAAERPATMTATRIEDGHFLVTARAPKGDEGDGHFAVTFPGTFGDIVYTPGLASLPVHVPRANAAFDHFFLALSDGLIGLGGGWYVVKDQSSVHVAARITPSSGDVVFTDDTVHPEEAQVWRFHLVQGDETRAASVASGLNVLPKVWR
jgi:hypothetical protein